MNEIMVGTTAQLVALACHFNAQANGASALPFYLQNSTCKFCEYIRFVRPKKGWFASVPSWTTVAESPDEWLAGQAKRGAAAMIVNLKDNGLVE